MDLAVIAMLLGGKMELSDWEDEKRGICITWGWLSEQTGKFWPPPSD